MCAQVWKPLVGYLKANIGGVPENGIIYKVKTATWTHHVFKIIYTYITGAKQISFGWFGDQMRDVYYKH